MKKAKVIPPSTFTPDQPGSHPNTHFKNKNASVKTEPYSGFVKFLFLCLFIFIVKYTYDYTANNDLEGKSQQITELEQLVAGVPASEIEENLRIYRELHNLDPDNTLYTNKISKYELDQRNAVEKLVVDYEYLCAAAIATLNGRELKGNTSSRRDGSFQFEYVRDADNKKFKYRCLFQEGNEVRWKDEYMSAWNTNTRLRYILNVNSLVILMNIGGEESYRTFAHTF